MEIINKSCLKIIVHGEVQGVGFRYFIARRANELGLTGLVKNLWNGDVEVVAEGRKDFLEDLIEHAKEGPPHSHVESTKIEWLDFKNKYNKFEIK